MVLAATAAVGYRVGRRGAGKMIKTRQKMQRMPQDYERPVDNRQQGGSKLLRAKAHEKPLDSRS
jgi:hypothetical protein